MHFFFSPRDLKSTLNFSGSTLNQSHLLDATTKTRRQKRLATFPRGEDFRLSRVLRVHLRAICSCYSFVGDSRFHLTGLSSSSSSYPGEREREKHLIDVCPLEEDALYELPGGICLCVFKFYRINFRGEFDIFIQPRVFISWESKNLFDSAPVSFYSISFTITFWWLRVNQKF